MPNNFAFIDGQNIHLGIQARGWKLDWRRFRVHLQHSYGVSRAYYFIGYIPTNEPLYDNLRQYGYTLVFKEVVYGEKGKPKGNIDAELVLQAMKDINDYEKAVLVTSDGDFAVLVNHLKTVRKFGWVICPGILGARPFSRRPQEPRLLLWRTLGRKSSEKYEGEPSRTKLKAFPFLVNLHLN